MSAGTAEPATTGRAQRRLATIEEIKRRSREQLTANGHGGLSLRAVARDMRVSSAAVYRYFPNHGDLITALCVDAYADLAITLESARDSNADAGHAQQMWAIFHRVRRWALDNPADFALIFGTPIPGYHAPGEITGPVAGRIITAILGVYIEAANVGTARLDDLEFPDTPGPSAQEPQLPGLAQPQMANALIAAAQSAWASILGFIVSELWGNLPLFIANTDALFHTHLRTVLRNMGFQPPEPDPGS